MTPTPAPRRPRRPLEPPTAVPATPARRVARSVPGSSPAPSPRPDSGTHHVRRPRRAAASATARARRVFPMPARPVNVTRRVVPPRTTSTSLDISASRPTSRDNGTGIEPPIVDAAIRRACSWRSASRSNRCHSPASRSSASARARTDENRGVDDRSVSRLRMVRTLTPARSANSSWVSRARRRNPRNTAPND
jgi:hypothetical protein